MAYALRNKEFDKKKKANLLEFLLASIVIPSVPPTPWEKIRKRLLNQIQKKLVT